SRRFKTERMRHGGARPRAGRKPAPGESYEAAGRRKETALDDLRELEVRKRRGELVDAAQVAREWADVLRTVRAGMLAIVSRLRARLPHLTPDAHAVDHEIRAALTAAIARRHPG